MGRRARRTAAVETAPLFEVAEADPGREHQACDRCLIGAWASNDALRVRGWQVYDGASVTGLPLHVRICPTCQRKGAPS
jgi:hypothetical protein